MAFMALFGWIFIPILLLYGLHCLVDTALEVLIRYSFWINVGVGVLLVVNLLLLILFIGTWTHWKRSGRMEKEYCGSFTGWQRLWRDSMRYLLPLGAVWEVLMILLCLLYLVVQPLKYLV